MPKPTPQTYRELQQAFDHFNRTLFGRTLPPCIITLQRERRTYGYFSGERWTTEDGELTDEIALNPAHFIGRHIEDTLSTLVHEMAHQWQHHHGSPGRGRYHNTEWAEKMEEIGLMPSNTGEPGGKRTGDQMDHFIIKDGPYDTSVTALLKSGFVLTWADVAGEPQADGGTTSKSKVKYSCPACGVNVWGKPELNLLCGDCTTKRVPAPLEVVS